MKSVTDYYNRLNFSPDATEDNIRQAYRKLARRYHPDVNSQPDAKDKFQKIQEAYEILNNPTQRKRYDHWRSQQGLDKSAALSVQAIANDKVLELLAEEQAYYVLLDIMPVAHLLERTKNLSAAGRKTIRYGTRTLTVPSKESTAIERNTHYVKSGDIFLILSCWFHFIGQMYSYFP